MADHLFTYIDAAGMEYTLNDGVWVRLKAGGMTGFGVLQPEIATERAPYAHGVAVVGAPVTLDRRMSLAFNMMEADLSAWTARMNALQRATNLYKDPERMGKLKCVTPDGRTRYCDCWCVEVPDVDQEVPTHGVGIFTFWANSPWFYDQVTETVALWTQFAARRTLPMTLPETLVGAARTGVTLPMTLPSMLSANLVRFNITLENSGDVETWPVFTILGPARLPKLNNQTTGKRLQLLENNDAIVTAGGYIVVDMAAGTVMRTEGGETVSIINSLTEGSQFWSLKQGNNVLYGELWLDTGGSLRVSYPRLFASL